VVYFDVTAPCDALEGDVAPNLSNLCCPEFRLLRRHRAFAARRPVMRLRCRPWVIRYPSTPSISMRRIGW